VIKRADRHAQKYFRNGGELNWPEGSQSAESTRAVEKMKSLQEIVCSRLDGTPAAHFTDLLRKLLAFAPEDRITPDKALEHSAFRIELPSEELIMPANVHRTSSPRINQSRSGNSHQRASKQGTAPQAPPTTCDSNAYANA